MLDSHTPEIAQLDIASRPVDLRAIEPRNGPQYSPNLYRWMKSISKDWRDVARVFTGSDGYLFIGHCFDDNFCGAKMNTVLCNGVKAMPFSYPASVVSHEIHDFWPEYERIGRCAIDKEHTQYFIGDETRWKVEGETRHCLWCGNHTQHLKRWEEVVQHEKWESASA